MSNAHPYAKALKTPEKPNVTLLGPGPLTSWKMSAEDEAHYWKETKAKFGLGSFEDTEGLVHRNGGVRSDGTTGAAGLFRETIALVKKVTGFPESAKMIFMEGGHNAANIGHANLFATEPEVPVVAICNGGFSGDVWGKDLKEQYEAKGALDKVILVNVPDGQSATADQVKAALAANGVVAGAPFNITFTSSETSTSVMMPKQAMIDILNIPGRKRALIDASSGLMVHEIPGIDGVGANGRTKDGLTRGVSLFATGQKGLRLPTDYTAFALCKEDLDVLEEVNQKKARIPMPKAIRIEKPELDANAIKRSSRVRGCLEVHYGLTCMKWMQERGHDHIKAAETTSQYVKDAVAKSSDFKFFVPSEQDRSTYNIVLVSENERLNALPPAQRAAAMAEAHELLADEGRATDVKPYGTRGDFRFTTLDIQSEAQARVTLENLAYAVDKAITKLQSKEITLIAEDQFLYSTPKEVEAAFDAKRIELLQKGIYLIDGRHGWGSERDYTGLPAGKHAIYKPDLTGAQITAEFAKIHKSTFNKTAIIVAAKTVPPEAKFNILVREGAGVNNMPLEQASKDGNVVVNCPGVNSKVTSNNTLNALAGHQHINNMHDMAMAGKASALNLQPLYGKSPEVDTALLNDKVRDRIVTVLGAGDIGTQTILGLLESSAKEVRVYSRGLVDKIGEAQLRLLSQSDKKFAKLKICSSIGEAMTDSNALINHLALVPGSAKNGGTTNIVGADQLNKLASNADVIDASRLGVIDPEALVAAYKCNKVARAVVDFDTPDKAKATSSTTSISNPTQDLFNYAKEIHAGKSGHPYFGDFLFCPHSFADTCPDTRAGMLDTALTQAAEIRLGKVYNFKGNGTIPNGLENYGARKPEGIGSLAELLTKALKPSLVDKASTMPREKQQSCL